MAECALMRQVLDPLHVLGQLSIPLSELTTQALDLLLQTRLGGWLLRPLVRSRHASDGTPIDRPCTDPVNCYSS